MPSWIRIQQLKLMRIHADPDPDPDPDPKPCSIQDVKIHRQGYDHLCLLTWRAGRCVRTVSPGRLSPERAGFASAPCPPPAPIYCKICYF